MSRQVMRNEGLSMDVNTAMTLIALILFAIFGLFKFKRQAKSGGGFLSRVRRIGERYIEERDANEKEVE